MLYFICQRSIGFLVDISFTDFLFIFLVLFIVSTVQCVINLTSDMLRYLMFLMFQRDKIDVYFLKKCFVCIGLTYLTVSSK